MHTPPHRILAGTAGLALAALAAADEPAARNVILLISDGAGDTTWLAADQWEFGTDARSGPEFVQRFAGDGFRQHWMSTYPADTQPLPPGQADVRLGLPSGSLPRYLPQLWNELPIPNNAAYDPALAWDATPSTVRLFANDNGLLLDRGPLLELTPIPDNPPLVVFLAQQLAADGTVVSTLDDGFAAYDWLSWNGTTDSAAAGTAIASGRKTYNSAINYVDNGTDLEPVPFITQQAKAFGRRTGIVTTKPFTDATPASFGTQNDFRDDEAEISDDMIHSGLLDVIITPGHPEFGSGGAPSDPDYGTISQANLDALRDGSAGWTLVEDVPGLENIADGSVPAPQRLFGLVPVSSQLNSRDTSGRTNAYDPRVFDPADPNGAVPFVMPDLPVLVDAALRSLEQGPDGFFLMVENASVDSGNHANDLPRVIEEQLAFHRAVDAVIDWVDEHSSWDETLVIVTTDHANALFLGPDSDTVFFQPPVAVAPGEMPQGIFWSTNHTNELVPLWTRGPGSTLFDALVDGEDPVRGDYIDNTDVYTVMRTVIDAETRCPDADGDGQVGFSDVIMVLASFGAEDPSVDFDGSGVVDLGDLLIVLAGFGGPC